MVGKLDLEEIFLPDFFKETSSEPYPKHGYKLVYFNEEQKIFDNYSDLIQIWWNTSKNLLDYDEVLDQKKIKKQSGGFN